MLEPSLLIGNNCVDRQESVLTSMVIRQFICSLELAGGNLQLSYYNSSALPAETVNPDRQLIWTG